jgi:hypothetical protein
MQAIRLAIAITLLGAGCAANDACPSFAHIIAGDWWTLEVEQLSGQKLTFNQADVPANFLEYRWAIDVDSDRDGAVDVRAAIEHFVMMGAAPVTTTDVLSQTTDDLWHVTGSVASNVGTFTATLTGDTFRFETTTSGAAGLADVMDRAQSTWNTVYRSGAEPDDQCDEQWR